MVSVRDPFASLLRLGVVHKGHFVYTSRRHGEFYVSIDKGEYEPLPELYDLCRLMAEFSTDNIEVVVGAATGGTTIGRLVAVRLSELLARQIPFVLFEKTKNDNILAIRPADISLVAGKNGLLVDDVLHMGTTVRRVLQIIRGIRGRVAGVSVVWNRGDLRAGDLGVPWLYAPIVHPLPSYPPPCPLCLKGIPVNTDMGHGKEFLAQKANPAD